MKGIEEGSQPYGNFKLKRPRKREYLFKSNNDILTLGN